MQYVKLVEFLLSNLKWPSEYLKHAMNEAKNNSHLYRIIKKKLNEVKSKEKNVKSKSSCFKCIQ